MMAQPKDPSAFWKRQRELPHGQERPEPEKQRRLAVWWIGAAIAGGLACGAIAWWAGPVSAAERNQSWDVFAFRDGRLLQVDARNIVPVQSSGSFATKRLCEDVGIQTVRIRDAGWRLSCRRVDQ